VLSFIDNTIPNYHLPLPRRSDVMLTWTGPFCLQVPDGMNTPSIESENESVNCSITQTNRKHRLHIEQGLKKDKIGLQ
jgi:hypothetical protein